MVLTPKLELRQGQQLVMTPQLQQAIRLLQLSNLELGVFVETELERNPLLERDEAAREADEADEAQRRRTAEDAGKRGGHRGAFAGTRRRAERGPPAGRPGPAGRRSSRARTTATAARTPTSRSSSPPTRSLADHLTEQLHLMVTDPAERLIGVNLIHMVDEAGYLPGSLDDVAARLGAPIDLVERVLADAAGLRPAGRVRARSRRVPGAAAQGCQPLRPADRQAARQPRPARQPQSERAATGGRRRRRRAGRDGGRDQEAQPQAGAQVRLHPNPADPSRRAGAARAGRQLDDRAQQRDAAARAGQPQLLRQRRQDGTLRAATGAISSTACRTPTGWSRASTSAPARSCASPRRSCASRTAFSPTASST